MSNQFPESEDELLEDVRSLHERLLTDGQQWRRPLPSTERLNESATSLARPAAMLPQPLERKTNMSMPSPAPTRRRSSWLALSLGAIVMLIGVASFVLFSTLNHHNQRVSSVFVPAGTCANTSHLFGHIQLNKLSMISPTEGWAVGAILNQNGSQLIAGTIWHLKDCQWQEYHAGFSLANVDLTQIVMLSPNDGWISGTISNDPNSHDPVNDPTGLVFFRYSQGQWQQAQIPVANAYNEGKIYPVAANEAWLVVDTFKSFAQGGPINCCGQLLHEQGGKWSKLALPTLLAQREFGALSSIGPNDAWFYAAAVSESPQDHTYLVHYHAGNWATFPLPNNTQIYDIQMLSATDGWAAGVNSGYGADHRRDPVALHFDGTRWQDVPLTNPVDPDFAGEYLQSISMVSAQEGWITGFSVNSGAESKKPVFYHCQLGQCTRVNVALRQDSGTPVPGSLADDVTANVGVTMVTPDNGWAIITGDVVLPTETSHISVYHALIFHYDGKTWTLVQQ
jgi:hypothetical protein